MSEPVSFAPGVTVEKLVAHDIYKGTIPALLAAGIIEQRHLQPQEGRRRGCTHFMPDGSAVPAGVPVPASLPGVFSVQIDVSGQAEARRTVDVEERARREYAESTVYWRGEHHVQYRGSRERLVRDGVPERWLEGLPPPGKKRGWRTLREGEQEIEVSASETRFRVDVRHIDLYKSWGNGDYLRKRAEFGLPLVVRKHLSLVWSQPDAGRARHG